MEIKIKPIGLIPGKKMVKCPGCAKDITLWLTGAGLRKVIGAYVREGKNHFECQECGTEFELEECQ